ncbi:MAG: ABC transporter permease [Eubacteriaceae bacterium]|nr:ABC transporter permease [Eubacteriaceae bacterium]
MIKLLAAGIGETLYMTLVSTFVAYIIGLPVGILLYITDEDGIKENKVVNKVLGTAVNLLRSIPFILFLVAIMPVTRFIVGTTIGSTATIVPLVGSAAPYIARMVESSLKEVDYGVIEAARSMGANAKQIIFKVLLVEAKPSLIVGAAITITTILGYTAMAGMVGGGGLGAIAINYGYYRYQTDIAWVTIALLIIVVQIFQEIGSRIAKHSDKRA